MTAGSPAETGEPATGTAAGDRSDGTAPDRLLLVYQMQKVASMSWMVLGRRHFAVSDTVHVHYVAEENLAFLRAQFESTGPQQTIARRLLLRNALQTGTNVRRLLDGAAVQSRAMLVVTGIRDPVARSASLLFFLADFYGHTEGGRSWRDAAQVDDIQSVFLATWEQTFEPEEPADTFARLLRFYFKAYRCWFDRELAAVLGVDVMGTSFPSGPARRLITQGRTQALVYRVEDMAPDRAGHALLCADLEAAFGAPAPGFSVHNATTLRNSRDLYRAFLHRLRVPARLLDRIYDDPVVRRFYLPEEIEGFRSRWLNGPS